MCCNKIEQRSGAHDYVDNAFTVAASSQNPVRTLDITSDTKMCRIYTKYVMFSPEKNSSQKHMSVTNLEIHYVVVSQKF